MELIKPVSSEQLKAFTVAFTKPQEHCQGPQKFGRKKLSGGLDRHLTSSDDTKSFQITKTEKKGYMASHKLKLTN